jgi:hypothetical protein
MASQFIPAVRSTAAIHHHRSRTHRAVLACIVFLLGAWFSHAASAAGPAGSDAFRRSGPEQGLATR